MDEGYLSINCSGETEGLKKVIGRHAMPRETEFSSEYTDFNRLLGGDEIFYVPSHQRDYSWRKENVQRLWDDITKTINEGRPEHFMGSLLVKQENNHALRIIDGQQRLATVSILFSALRDVRRNLGHDETSFSLAERFIGRLDTSTREREPKLHLSDRNHRTYQEFITKERTLDQISAEARKRTTSSTNRLLLEAYMLLRSSLEDRIEKSKRKEDALVEIETCIQEKLTAVLITVSSSANPYLIFETLNERGQGLGVADLVKNYLFAQAYMRLNEVEGLWNEMISALERQDVSRFIRHYWISKRGLTRMNQVYRAVESQVSGVVESVELVRDLCEKAKVYGALINPDSPLWDDYPSETRDYLAELILFGTNQCYPVLLAVQERPPKRFPGVARVLSLFSFRYSIVSKGGTGPLEAAYGQICREIQSGRIKGVQDIFRRLDRLWPSEIDFERDFSNMTLPSSRNKLSRYILAKIEDKQRQDRERVTDPDNLTLEHVMPRNPSQEWHEEWRDLEIPMEEFVNRFGNMTLLLEKPGRGIKNASFKEKVSSVYAHSDLIITQGLLEYSKWGANEIQMRQEKLAKVACRIWNLTI